VKTEWWEKDKAGSEVFKGGSTWVLAPNAEGKLMIVFVKDMIKGEPEYVAPPKIDPTLDPFSKK